MLGGPTHPIGERSKGRWPDPKAPKCNGPCTQRWPSGIARATPAGTSMPGPMGATLFRTVGGRELGVRLVPMKPDEFRAFYDRNVRDYASDMIRADQATPENALEKSEEEMVKLLPQGQETPNHQFLSVISEPGETRAGEVWYALQDYPAGRELFVYWLGIAEPYRRKGYATATVHSLEALAKKEKVRRVALAVFGNNREAQMFYDRLGFSATTIVLVKPVERT